MKSESYKVKDLGLVFHCSNHKPFFLHFGPQRRIEICRKTWSQIKDSQYGKKGTLRRDQLDREFEAFKIGLLLRNARESKKMTQEDLAKVIDKKRTYISRVENDGSNITLKTLFEIVEKGLGGKVTIGIKI